MRLRSSSLSLLVIGLAAGACKKKESSRPAQARDAEIEAAPPDTRPATGSASVTGKVTYQGALPSPTPIKFAWGEGCEPLMKEKETHHVRVNKDGGLFDVFVYISKGLPDGATYPIPTEPLPITNRDCQFEPRVAGIRVGQKFEMSNDDNVVHNFHGFGAKEFNVAMTKKGLKIQKSFSRAEVMVLVLCDIHPWMHSFIGALDHPFFCHHRSGRPVSDQRPPSGTIPN